MGFGSSCQRAAPFTRMSTIILNTQAGGDMSRSAGINSTEIRYHQNSVSSVKHARFGAGAALAGRGSG